MRILKIATLIFVLLLPAMSIMAQGKEKVHKRFKKMLKKKDVHNGFLHLKSTDGTLDWKFVGGTFQEGTAVTEKNPFHAASVGKMLTATLIMKLAEEGKLKLEDSVAVHLPAEILRGLHVYKGKEYTGKITISQLLQHTSGLPDYIGDTPKDGSPSVMGLALQHPEKVWEVEDFLTFAKTKLEAHFPPGEGYYYTDTEYVLLGLIIEKKYQKKLHEVFLEVLFEPLGMKNTAMFGRSTAINPTQKMAELYIDETEISTYKSLSIDWAGGGLVSTTEDLLKFHQALFSGEIISLSSLKKMQCWVQESKGTYYGFGLRKYDFKELTSLLPKMTIIGHSGLTASFSFYCPELDIYAAGTFNQTTQMKEAIRFLIQTLVTLKLNSKKQ